MRQNADRIDSTSTVGKYIRYFDGDVVVDWTSTTFQLKYTQTHFHVRRRLSATARARSRVCAVTLITICHRLVYSISTKPLFHIKILIRILFYILFHRFALDYWSSSCINCSFIWLLKSKSLSRAYSFIFFFRRMCLCTFFYLSRSQSPSVDE